MNRVKLQVILLIIGAGLFVLCTRHAGQKSRVLAEVDSRIITESDFVQRVELSPLPPDINIRTFRGREDALDLLIAEKLFAIEAEKAGLQNDPVFLHKIENVKRSAVRRELYRDVVQKKVKISEEDLKKAFNRMNEKNIVRFVQSKDINRINLWHRLLNDGMPFDTLLNKIAGKKVSEKFNRIEFTWGQAEPVIEDAAHNLNKGEVSEILKVSNGYIILKLENRIKNVMLAEEKYQSKKTTIDKIIRRRREAVRSGKFVEEFMKGKNVVLKGKAFNFMTKELEKQIEFNKKSKSSPKVKMLVRKEVQLVQDNLANHLDDKLITFNGRAWTTGQFLEKLWMMEVPVNRQSPEKFRKGLQESIRIMVRNELLADEGMRRGLDRSENVQKELQMWRDNFLYVLMKNRYREKGGDVGEEFDILKKNHSVKVDTVLLKKITLTHVPMVGVWTDFQRQLVAPIWPQL